MDALSIEIFESQSHCVDGNEPENALSSGGGTATEVGPLCLLSAQASSFNTLRPQWFSCSVPWERICSCQAVLKLFLKDSHKNTSHYFQEFIRRYCFQGLGPYLCILKMPVYTKLEHQESSTKQVDFS